MKNYLLNGKNVLITAGPTREPIDPVRYISNHTGGRMGYDLAAFLLQQNAKVFLVSGPVRVDLSHPNLTVVKVNTGYEMYLACCQFFEEADIAIFSAAVPDFRPKEISPVKIKVEDAFSIKMIRNIDVAGAFSKVKKMNQFTVGFAIERDDNVKQAVYKMQKKNFDLVVLNSLSAEEETYGIDINTTSLIKSDYTIEQLKVKSKALIVKDIVSAISTMLSRKQPSVSKYHPHTTTSTSQSLPA